MSAPEQKVAPGWSAVARPLTRVHLGRHTLVLVLLIALVLLILLSLGLGRFMIKPQTVFETLVSRLMNMPPVETPMERAIILDIRPPRILAAVIVGAALSASGAAYQTMFRNPLVSPEILGVAAGAGFGASIGILLGAGVVSLEVLSFGCGLLAALLALGIGRVAATGSLSILVLGGIVIGAMFGALIAATQYFADPETTLPEITFWLFGSLGRATLAGLRVPTLIVTACLGALYAVRWPLTVIAAGDDEARTMGVNLRLVWTVVICASTLMTATVVSLAGIIGWVGLVVPHLARFAVGSSFSRLLPASVLIGAIYLLVVDDVARSASPIDLPLGILTALIGAPFFILLLIRSGRQLS